jgi:hypothetical protein
LPAATAGGVDAAAAGIAEGGAPLSAATGAGSLPFRVMKKAAATPPTTSTPTRATSAPITR